MIKQLLFISSAMTLGLAAQAQTLPTPVAKIDFEGITSAEDLGAELVGAGEGSFAEASDIRTINGMRVSAPVRGINIVRKGNSYVKVMKMKD